MHGNSIIFFVEIQDFKQEYLPTHKENSHGNNHFLMYKQIHIGFDLLKEQMTIKFFLNVN